MLRIALVLGLWMSTATLHAQASSLSAQAAAERAPEPEPRRHSFGLMIGGLGTLAGSYFLPLFYAGLRQLGDRPQLCTHDCTDPLAKHLLIPFAGPWLALSDAQGVGKAALVVVGLAQITGLVLTACGIARFVAGEPVRPARRRLSLSIVPVANGLHASLRGRF